MRKLLEKITEKIFLLCGCLTGIVVLLIVFFLFKEGSGIFSKNVVEEDYTVLIHSNNPVSDLRSETLKDIFDYKIANWQELGGPDMDIVPFRMNDIESYCSYEDLGEDYEHVPQCLNKILSENEGIIAFVPDEFVLPDINARLVDPGNITFKQLFLGEEWMPTATPAPQFGLLPLITGTLWVSFAAILIALPLGLGVAIYLSEIADKRIRKIFKPVIELLAGIPSVVYGFFGLVVLVPFIQKVFNLPIGETGLSGALILAIMALPTIITIAEDAIRNTPKAMKEASLALGATHWQTIFKVVLPYSASGITAAGVLGIGRAIGETMAVLMVTGNAAVIPHTLLEPLRTIPATIAAELGEAPKGGAHYQSLFILGMILFLITLLINLIVEFVAKRSSLQSK